MNGEFYEGKSREIKSRLNDFQNLSEEEKFKEFMFCLLTPQSNARRCWGAVEEISKLNKLSEKEVNEILSKKTRFHNVKTKRILEAKESFEKIKKDLDCEDIVNLRNFLAEEINGYGLKEASHFLRNIGKSNNKIAILDRHILRNLGVEKIKGWKDYLEVEEMFLSKAKELGISADELDLLWWSQENGEIFK